MRLVIAGGGTGGHLFPGLAIAEAFMEREAGNEVLFIGTERGIEVQVLSGGVFPLKTIQALPIKGGSLLRKARALWSLPKAVLEALSILKDFRPQLVLGVGGYASGPVMVAALLLGMKRAIHEQNVIPGMTNRLLRWFSQKIFISFEETRKYFPKKKTILTGNPIRKQFFSYCPTEKEEIGGKRKDLFTVLVLGGSSGAHRLNEKMSEALDSLEEIKSHLRFIHQTGSKDFDFISKIYQEKGFEAIVKPFIENMASTYQISDLVISRAGASTLAELALCGKAVILIPYPYAAHNHQLINAQRLVRLGAAKMIQDEELSGPRLAKMVLHFYQHPEERARMEEAILKIARPRASEEIVDHCYKLLRGGE